MDPEAVLDVRGKPVVIRLHEGSRERPPRMSQEFGAALSSAIDGMYRTVIVEARGLRGDAGRASALASALAAASDSLGCERPLCMPPSAASGTMTCSFRAYYEDFQEFAAGFLAELEAALVHAPNPGTRRRLGGLFRRGGR
ncbi:MAG: hypothetical protein JHC24_02295 [Thaumarchaeota archaeon]|nr:hypothetical protein [Nitrososphaerota archaeon]